ncbi:MAG: hypothetical protein N3E47_00680 [Candidatus Bathyarchaeota archaeon]|nr:hypothetical protein [Candidatus Bathyarchaeota archaeon]
MKRLEEYEAARFIGLKVSGCEIFIFFYDILSIWTMRRSRYEDAYAG